MAHLTAMKRRRAADSWRFSQEAGKGWETAAREEVNSGGGGGKEKAAVVVMVRPSSGNLGQMGRFLSRDAREERGKGDKGEKSACEVGISRGPGLEEEWEEKEEKKLAEL